MSNKVEATFHGGEASSIHSARGPGVTYKILSFYCADEGDGWAPTEWSLTEAARDGWRVVTATHVGNHLLWYTLEREVTP